MLLSGEIQSQTELCNVAQRLGLSEEDIWLSVTLPGADSPLWHNSAMLGRSGPANDSDDNGCSWAFHELYEFGFVHVDFFAPMSHKMMTRCRCCHQDALRVAVALWALSDGKALSLRLLVGALEGFAQLKDHRCWQTAWWTLTQWNIMEHHGTSHHKQQSSTTKGLDLSTLQIIDEFDDTCCYMLLPFLFGRWKHRNITADDREIQLLAPDSSLVPGRSGGFFRIRWGRWASESVNIRKRRSVGWNATFLYIFPGWCLWRKPTWRSFE